MPHTPGARAEQELSDGTSSNKAPKGIFALASAILYSDHHMCEPIYDVLLPHQLHISLKASAILSSHKIELLLAPSFRHTLRPCFCEGMVLLLPLLQSSSSYKCRHLDFLLEHRPRLVLVTQAVRELHKPIRICVPAQHTRMRHHHVTRGVSNHCIAHTLVRRDAAIPYLCTFYRSILPQSSTFYSLLVHGYSRIDMQYF
jgi:hypothetical protein